MKELRHELRGAAVATLVLAAVCCGLYPAAVWGLGQLLFPHQANGSLMVDKSGAVIGSELLGQGFTAEKYFHPRPSAAGNGYDALNSGGSNWGPTSQKLRDAIKDRLDAYRKKNGLPAGAPVPADAVTASGSGLDPHISVRNAQLQAPRVARARGLDEAQVDALVKQHTQGPDFGKLGEAGVNVVTLNVALDRLEPKLQGGQP